MTRSTIAPTMGGRSRAREVHPKRGTYSFRGDLVWGQGAYWVVVPERVSESIGIRGRITVLGQVNGGTPFFGTLMPAGQGRHRLMVNERARNGARTGQLAVRIRVDNALREVPLPDDFADALAEAGARAGWGSYPAGKREHIVAWIEEAARETTRTKRIAFAVEKALARSEKLADRPSEV